MNTAPAATLPTDSHTRPDAAPAALPDAPIPRTPRHGTRRARRVDTGASGERSRIQFRRAAGTPHDRARAVRGWWRLVRQSFQPAEPAGRHRGAHGVARGTHRSEGAPHRFVALRFPVPAPDGTRRDEV